MYTFEDTARQYHSQYSHTDSIKDILFNVDLSMRAQAAFIIAADNKAFYNFRTNIYVPALDEPPFWEEPNFIPTNAIFPSNTTAGNNTEAELIYLPEGESFLRNSYFGLYADQRPREDGTKRTEVQYISKPYYRYIDNLVYNHAITPCLPPYNDVNERL